MALKSKMVDKVQKQLVKGCDEWLKTFDKKTGKFLADNGGWAVTMQDNIYLLSYLYLNDFDGNHYYKEDKYLDIIKAGGDVLRDAQREDGKVLFVKPDGSTWGYTYMPWSMFHWLQTYDLMQDRLDKETVDSWKKGLLLAYDGIMKSLQSLHIHNIPVWNSAAIYRAGDIFNREDYKDIANKMIEKTLEEQHEDGFWPEHQGPTMSYNAVYIYSLAVYKFYNGPVDVNDALKKSYKLQQVSTYPDGTLVETADGRVKYKKTVRTGDLIGYLHIDGGYKFINFILDKVIEKGQSLSVRFVNFLRYLETLPEFEQTDEDPVPMVDDIKVCHGDIQIIKKCGWQANLSSYTAPVTDSRWGMDRQLFLSVWHKDKGLLVGGGNTKNKPKWGTFNILSGKDNLYVPDKAEKYPKDSFVNLYYGKIKCTVKVKEMTKDKVVLEYGYDNKQDISKVQIGLPLRFSCDPNENKFNTKQSDKETIVSFKGYDVKFKNTKHSLKWPVKPFNPYHKEGKSPEEYWVGLLNIDITNNKKFTVTISKNEE